MLKENLEIATFDGNADKSLEAKNTFENVMNTLFVLPRCFWSYKSSLVRLGKHYELYGFGVFL